MKKSTRTTQPKTAVAIAVAAFLTTTFAAVPSHAWISDVQSFNRQHGNNGNYHVNIHENNHQKIYTNNSYNNQTYQQQYQQQYQQNYQVYQTTFNQNQQQLRDLLREHAVVGAQAFMARYDNSPQFDQLNQRVNQNTNNILNIMATMCPDKHDGFQTLWNQHIQLLTQYTDAMRDHNNDARNYASQALDATVDQFASVMASDRVGHDQWASAFRDHINMEKAIINAHAAGDNAQVDWLMSMAGNHAAWMADLFATGCFKQYQQGQYPNAQYQGYYPRGTNVRIMRDDISWY